MSRLFWLVVGIAAGASGYRYYRQNGKLPLVGQLKGKAPLVDQLVSKVSKPADNAAAETYPNV